MYVVSFPYYLCLGGCSSPPAPSSPREWSLSRNSNEIRRFLSNEIGIRKHFGTMYAILCEGRILFFKRLLCAQKFNMQLACFTNRLLDEYCRGRPLLPLFRGGGREVHRVQGGLQLVQEGRVDLESGGKGETV